MVEVTQRRGLAVVVATLLVGPIPMALLAAMDGTLLPSSTHKFPLVAVPSVVVGDFLLLPLFNRAALPIIVEAGRALLTRRRRFLVSLIVVLLAVSVAINAATHYSWVHDDYTGYTDSQLGQLSPAGWWHLGFSIVEMVVVGLFVILWIGAARSQALNRAQRGYVTAGFVLVAFTSLGVVGAVVTRLVILPGVRLPASSVLVSVAPFVAATAVLAYTMRLARPGTTGKEKP